jgi:hypothetical protein
MDHYYRDLAVMHREIADLALYEEARIYHLAWAERCERWADTTPRIDYSAITRDIVGII